MRRRLLVFSLQAFAPVSAPLVDFCYRKFYSDLSVRPQRVKILNRCGFCGRRRKSGEILKFAHPLYERTGAGRFAVRRFEFRTGLRFSGVASHLAIRLATLIVPLVAGPVLRGFAIRLAIFGPLARYQPLKLYSYGAVLFRDVKSPRISTPPGCSSFIFLSMPPA